MTSSGTGEMPATVSARVWRALAGVVASVVTVGVVTAGIVAVPAVAHAVTGPTGGTGLHDGMMPATSPDAQPTLGANPAVQAAGTVPLGVDVSGWQHPSGAAITWLQVAGSGQSFAIVKATELYTDSSSGQPVLYTNPYLHGDLTAASAAGLVVGAYTFAHPENSPTVQADDFAQAIGTLPAGSLPPVLDLEDSGGLTVSQLVTWTHAFLTKLETDTGIIPMIYTGPSFWRTYLSGNTGFADYPLWEAHYTTATTPAAIGGWSGYTLWQYTSSAAVPGISGAVDESRSNGTPLSSVAQLAGPSAIAAKAADPTVATLLGAPDGAVVCGLAANGCGQQFASGFIYWSATTGAHVIRGSIWAEWAALGWENNLGYPTTDEFCGLVNGGCGQHFSNSASVYWSSTSGAHEVRGALRQEWAALGWEKTWMGYPTADELCGLTGGGCGQAFQGGWDYWSSATGAHALGGVVAAEWIATGWERGLGYPTTDEFCGLVNGGCGQHFSNSASVYWSSTSGAHEVRGALRQEWAALGWEKSWMGYPTADELCGLTGGGCGQAFQGGWDYWSSATGAHALGGVVAAEWIATGWERGLGYPTTDEFCGLVNGGCGQHFSNSASVYWSSTSGAHHVSGAIRGAWAATGWERGTYAYPLGDPYTSGRSRLQRFQGGTISVPT